MVQTPLQRRRGRRKTPQKPRKTERLFFFSFRDASYPRDCEAEQNAYKTEKRPGYPSESLSPTLPSLLFPLAGFPRPNLEGVDGLVAQEGGDGNLALGCL